MANSQSINLNKASGFSLLEVLISIFVLAIGLLGLLNLQMISLKNNHSAQYRTSATVLSYDIIDRMRLNRDADYTLTMATTPSGTGLKNTDLLEWINELSSTLPSGDGSVAVAGDIVTVVVQWDDSRGNITGAPSTQQFTVSSER
jgi:type IV pilus assembly protein PilV